MPSKGGKEPLVVGTNENPSKNALEILIVDNQSTVTYSKKKETAS